MDLQTLFPFNKTEVKKDTCRFKDGRLHYHFTWPIEDMDIPREKRKTKVIENACSQMLKDLESTGKIGSALKDLNSLNDKFAAKTIEFGREQEQTIADGNFNVYMDETKNYLDERNWYAKDTMPQIMKVGGDEKTLSYYARFVDGMVARGIHTIYGTSTEFLDEHERGNGMGYFRSRLVIDGKNIYADSREMPTKTRTLEAFSKFVLLLRDFRTGKYEIKEGEITN